MIGYASGTNSISNTNAIANGNYNKCPCGSGSTCTGATCVTTITSSVTSGVICSSSADCNNSHIILTANSSNIYLASGRPSYTNIKISMNSNVYAR